MGHRLQVKLHIIIILRFVFEGDALGEHIAGHDVLEVVEQIRARVCAAGAESEVCAIEGDRGILRKGGGCKARHKRQQEQEGYACLP